MSESIGGLIARLETLLAEGFSAKGAGLAAKVRALGRELPDDLREALLSLADGQAGQDDPVGFAFQCGQAHERLQSLVQSRLAANIAFLDSDGNPPPLDLEDKDLDALARVVKLRDQFLKTVADYTLKFLLVSVVLLVIGVSLGLI